MLKFWLEKWKVAVFNLGRRQYINTKYVPYIVKSLLLLILQGPYW